MEAFTLICQDRVFASFLCALSVLGKLINLYCTISEKNKQGAVEDIEFPGVLKK